MTRKEKLILELRNLLTETGMDETQAISSSCSHRHETLRDIQEFINYTRNYFERKKAEEAREAYFLTEEGASKKSSNENELEAIKNRLEEIMKAKVEFANNYINEVLPGVAPYTVKYFRPGYYDTDGRMVLYNGDSSRLEIEIYKYTDLFSENKISKITLNVSAIGQVDINDLNHEGRTYYRVVGELFAHNEEVTKMFNDTVDYLEEERQSLIERGKIIQKWLENPLG